MSDEITYLTQAKNRKRKSKCEKLASLHDKCKNRVFNWEEA